MMRNDPMRAWTMRALAEAAGMPPARLRETFLEEFGMTPPSYLRLVRAARAVALLGTTSKVEAAAWDVGYRSKKDLYAVLRRWVGATPSELRALSPDERNWLERQLRVRCLHGTRASGTKVETAAGVRGDVQRRRRGRLARTSSATSVPPTSAAPPTSATAAYVTGPGGGGMAARVDSSVARRRASSSRRLASP